jgi:hypothetical protein
MLVVGVRHIRIGLWPDIGTLLEANGLIRMPASPKRSGKDDSLFCRLSHHEAHERV